MHVRASGLACKLLRLDLVSLASCRACSEMPCLLQEDMSPEKVMMEAIKGKGRYDNWRVAD